MLPISELMRREITMVSPDAPVRRVIEIMVETGVEAVLVVDGRGRVIGSIGDDQLIAGLHSSRTRSWWGQIVADGRGGPAEEHLSDLPAGEIMLGRVVPVDPTTSARAAIRRFDEHGVSVMAVVDRRNLVGAIYRGDLIRHLLLPYAFGRTDK
ncbi:MAG TPA: CBS domain-containing protein [Methylomirabilota bacterium]|nr:CBS domain-containing protein [Methylomirabilota bacterium]